MDLPAAPPGTSSSGEISLDELAMATRNHGMPLEALRYDTTPVGLHYLLIHYDIPWLDPDAWRLDVDGLVEQPLHLALPDLLARPVVTRRVTMECAGNGRARLHPRTVSQPWLHEAVGTGEWAGVPVTDVLREAGLSDRAVEVVFTGADRGVEGGVEQHYQRSLAVDELADSGALLAHSLNGRPLPPQHGAPARLIVPGWYGMTSVKWVTSMRVVDEPFNGYQHVQAYRTRRSPDDPGEPVTRVAVRSLMVPPGIPDFLSRRRTVDRGEHVLEGRAWSGWGPVTHVEVSVDGGTTWGQADLEPADDPAVWSRWSYRWSADAPGEVVLVCRATDLAGNRQPDQPEWNLGGYAVNAAHRVPVTVR